ncbi:MAG TPA: hypothetical protein VGN16_03670 [Acidobacteriaceae bacterium]|jgi:hypothetical protein
MSNPNDPIDPEAGRGKKEDGWKTVVIKSPFAQGNQDPQAAQGQQAPANYGQPQGGYAPPAPPQSAQTPAPQPPQFPSAPQPPAQAAPSFDKTQVYTHAPFATPPAMPPAAPPSSDKTQIYTQAPFASAPQNPAPPPGPPAAAQGYPPPPTGPGNFNPPAPGGGGYTPPPPPGGFPPGGARPPQGQPFPQQYGAPPQKKKSKWWLWTLLIVLGLILICVVGCIGLFVIGGKKLLNSPDVAIVTLHTRMGAHQDAQIYQNADDQWKTTVAETTSDAMFDQIGERLGTPMSYEIVGKPADLGGDLMQVEVNTKFTQGAATETIVFHKTSKGLKLYHYSIHATGPEIDHERVLNP